MSNTGARGARRRSWLWWAKSVIELQEALNSVTCGCGRCDLDKLFSCLHIPTKSEQQPQPWALKGGFSQQERAIQIKLCHPEGVRETGHDSPYQMKGDRPLSGDVGTRTTFSCSDLKSSLDCKERSACLHEAPYLSHWPCGREKHSIRQCGDFVSFFGPRWPNPAHTRHTQRRPVCWLLKFSLNSFYHCLGLLQPRPGLGTGGYLCRTRMSLPPA